MMVLRRAVLAVIAPLLIVGVFPALASAETPDSVLLTVHEGVEDKLFRLADLDALPQQRFSTTTVWTSGVNDYAGPALADVLAAAGLGVGKLRMESANDYVVTLEPEMIEGAVPIIVTRINGRPFGLRDRGPLWLMFPYDASPRYRSERIFAASIWQLTDIFTDAGR